MEVVGGPHGLTDRGSGKAAQLVAVDGETRQLVEVKLNVVRSDPMTERHENANAKPLTLLERNAQSQQQGRSREDLAADPPGGGTGGEPK